MAFKITVVFLKNLVSFKTDLYRWASKQIGFVFKTISLNNENSSQMYDNYLVNASVGCNLESF